MIWELLLVVLIILLALADLWWMKRQDRFEKERDKQQARRD